MRYAVCIIIALVVFTVLGILLQYLSDIIDECETFLGSFADTLTPEIKQNCAKVDIFFGPVVFVWIFSGFTLSGFMITVAFYEYKRIIQVFSKIKRQ